MKALIGKIVTINFLALFVFGCVTPEANPVLKETKDELVSNQKMDAVLWHNFSAESDYIYRQTYSYAAIKLAENVKNTISKKPLAVVLDIDETILNNNAYAIQQLLINKSYEPESWADFIKSESSTAFPGSNEFIDYCREMDIHVILISNRKDVNKKHTMNNLRKAGFIGFKDEDVLLKKETSDKTLRRTIVEENYEVILYLGDNLRDFDELFGSRREDYGKTVVKENFVFTEKSFVLFPNPVYGEWEKPILNDASTIEEEIAEKIKTLQQ